MHGSCAARGADAVLFLGPPGSGKSDLVLRLLNQGWRLVADDQVRLDAADGALAPSCPPALEGRLEVRGLGVFEAMAQAPAAVRLRLAVALAERAAVTRLPEPDAFACLGVSVPRVTLHAFDASTPAKVELALDAVTGRAQQAAGVFRK